MTSLRVAPCNWPLAYCGESAESTGGVTDPSQCSSLANLAPAMSVLVQAFAVAYLWNWTGQRYGTCPVVVRPCSDRCSNYWTTYGGAGGSFNRNLPYTTGGYPGPLNPALINGEWFNVGCGNCGGDPCSCQHVPTVSLRGPVASVTEVLVDGVVLSPTAYRVDNHTYLVRTDGGEWPTCQSQLLEPTQPDTFQVTYELGTEVPAGGQVAAGVLACEFAKAACNDGSCQLPRNLQSVTRQGVSQTLINPYDGLYTVGTSGIWIVDAWVASVNASKARAGLRVANPDVVPVRRRTA